MTVVAICFALGLGLFWQLGGSFFVPLVTASFIIVCGIVFFFKFLEKGKAVLNQNSLRAMILALLAGSLGILYGFFYYQLHMPWVPDVWSKNKVYAVECTIASLPNHYRFYSSFVADIHRVDGQNARGRIKVYWSSGAKKNQSRAKMVIMDEVKASNRAKKLGRLR